MVSPLVLLPRPALYPCDVPRAPRDLWLNDAGTCDKSGHVQTCQAIVREVIGVGVEDEDRLETWLEDAESFVKNEAYNAARAVYAHCLTAFPSNEDLWEQVAFFEKEHGTRESLNAHLRKAVKYCPQAETLWLMAAKSAWLGGNVPEARTILSNAFTAIPNNEDIWLAAVKLESENNEHDRARKLLEKARREAGTARVWMKSARLEWVLGNLEEASRMLSEAVQLHPTAPKLWMMRGQICEEQDRVEEARQYYVQGVKNCPHSIPLWILSARLEVKAGKRRTSRERGGEEDEGGGRKEGGRKGRVLKKGNGSWERRGRERVCVKNKQQQQKTKPPLVR